jgi:hypothetical protein
MRKTFLVGLILVIVATGLIVLGVIFRDSLFTFAGISNGNIAPEEESKVSDEIKEEEDFIDYYGPLEQPALEEEGQINGNEENSQKEQ